MRKPIVIISIVLAALFSQFTASAQLGWQWGTSSVPGVNSGIDAYSSVIDDSGNVIVAGCTGIYSGLGIADYIVYGADTVFNSAHIAQQIIVKTDSLGHIKWARGSQTSNTVDLGLTTDNNGNIYSYGIYTGNFSCTFGSITLSNPLLYSMYYLVKYSPAGNVVWAKNVLGNTRLVNLGAIGIDSLDNIYITGGFNRPSVTLGSVTLTNSSPAGDTFDVFLAKYDVLGNVITAVSFGGRRDDYPHVMDVSPTGNIYIAGYFQSDTMMVGSTLLTNILTGTYPFNENFFAKFNGSGLALWAKKMGHKIGLNALTLDDSEHVYLTGSFDSTLIIASDTLISAGGIDMLLAKYDSSGNAVWARSAGDALTNQGWSVSVDNCSNVWVAGATSASSAALNFSGHSIPVVSGWDPSFIAEYSGSGSFDTAYMLPGGGDDYLFVMVDNKGSFFLTGDYANNPIYFGPDTLISPSGMSEELFIARYKYDSLGCNPEFLPSLNTKAEFGPQNKISVYPNPSNDRITINSNPAFPSNSTAQIADLSGRQIGVYPLSGNSVDIELGNLAPGVYLCIIRMQGNQFLVHKLVVMH